MNVPEKNRRILRVSNIIFLSQEIRENQISNSNKYAIRFLLEMP
jgi:hypothetical protein